MDKDERIKELEAENKKLREEIQRLKQGKKTEDKAGSKDKDYGKLIKEDMAKQKEAMKDLW